MPDGKVGTVDIIQSITKTWTSEITQIVSQRKKEKIETKFEVSDLLRAKIMYKSIDHIKKSVSALDEACVAHGYKVIEMDNRLEKMTTQDVVFKIQIKDAICELQLALAQS